MSIENNTELPENTGRNQDGTFKSGVSGNPSGKPKGARHKTTLLVQELLDSEAETITRKLIELALNGDAAALRLAMERIIPAKRDGNIRVNIPKVTTAEDIIKSLSALVESVADGELTPSEGNAIASILESYRKSYETNNLEAKIEHLSSLIKTRNN